MKISKAASSNINDTILKHFFYVFSFSKEPVVISIDNKNYTFGNYKNVKLSGCFFRSIKCERCGNCCKNFPLIWDKKPRNLRVKEKEVIVNGKTFTIYYQPSINGNTHCRHYKDHSCDIYDRRPLLSRMPHMFVQENKGDVILLKRQFSRNHLLQCQSKVKTFDYDELVNVDIPNIKLLQDTSLMYGCKSYYTDVIQSLQTVTKEQEEEFSKMMILIKNKTNSTITFPHNDNLKVSDFDYNVYYKTPIKVKATLEGWM